jgi:hypothetical protein
MVAATVAVPTTVNDLWRNGLKGDPATCVEAPTAGVVNGGISIRLALVLKEKFEVALSVRRHQLASGRSGHIR